MVLQQHLYTRYTYMSYIHVPHTMQYHACKYVHWYQLYYIMLTLQIQCTTARYFGYFITHELNSMSTVDASSAPHSSWSATYPSSIKQLTPGGSPFRKLTDLRCLVPHSPLSSGQSSPEGNRRSREFISPRGPPRTRSRSLSPQQGQSSFSPYGIGHIPLHMSHTAVDSEISSIASFESRKSSVEAEGHGSGQNMDYVVTMENVRWRTVVHPQQLNGQNGGYVVGGDWKEEREGLLMEIFECQRRIQVQNRILYTCRGLIWGGETPPL